MNTIADRNVRTYYEVHNINIPTMTEPTSEQLLLENSDTYTDHTRTTQQTHTADTDHEKIPTNITEFAAHEKTTEFTELIKSTILNTPTEDRTELLSEIIAHIQKVLTEIVQTMIE